MQAVALQLCSAPGFMSMWIRLVVIGSRHPSSPSFAYRRETKVDVRCAQDPQTESGRRRSWRPQSHTARVQASRSS
eukprot:7137149-Prymnesium_polylepis.1